MCGAGDGNQQEGRFSARSGCCGSEPVHAPLVRAQGRQRRRSEGCSPCGGGDAAAGTTAAPHGPVVFLASFSVLQQALDCLSVCVASLPLPQSQRSRFVLAEAVCADVLLQARCSHCSLVISFSCCATRCWWRTSNRSRALMAIAARLTFQAPETQRNRECKRRKTARFALCARRADTRLWPWPMRCARRTG